MAPHLRTGGRKKFPRHRLRARQLVFFEVREATQTLVKVLPLCGLGMTLCFCTGLRRRVPGVDRLFGSGPEACGRIDHEFNPVSGGAFCVHERR